jgi:D-alanine-D-alanine ligase
MDGTNGELGGTVAVLHGAVSPDSRKDELDVLVQVRAVSDSLRRLGYEPTAVPVGLDLRSAARMLDRLKPRLVFNLVESIGGRDRLLPLGPLLLESLHLPYTGCGSAAMITSTSKVQAKSVLRRAGLPTPDWALPADVAAGRASLRYPALLKSGWDHASFGLEESYGSAAELERALAARGSSPGAPALPPAQELFAESYVDGREMNLSLLETEGEVDVLPPAEMRFVDYPQGKPRIVGYAAKWEEGSFEYTHTVRSFEFDAADEPLLRRIAELSRRCWELFELSGYARVDFRVDPEGEPWVLEVNANPCLSPDAGFAAAAARAGLGYDEVVRRLVHGALRRGGASARWSFPSSSVPPAPVAAPPPPGEGRSRQVPEAPRDARGRATALAFREGMLPGDVAEVRDIVASSGFFSGCEIQLAAELVEERLERGEASGYHFLFAETPDRPGKAEGYTCFGPIPCAPSSYDLYWIAVRGGSRGGGLGTDLLARSEERIRRLGGRRIYVETSSRPQYEPTRAFYTRRGYRVETVLADFYAPGDGKVILVKELS